MMWAVALVAGPAALLGRPRPAQRGEHRLLRVGDGMTWRQADLLLEALHRVPALSLLFLLLPSCLLSRLPLRRLGGPALLLLVIESFASRLLFDRPAPCLLRRPALLPPTLCGLGLGLSSRSEAQALSFLGLVFAALLLCGGNGGGSAPSLGLGNSSEAQAFCLCGLGSEALLLFLVDTIGGSAPSLFGGAPLCLGRVRFAQSLYIVSLRQARSLLLGAVADAEGHGIAAALPRELERTA
mmetsp:Transcript_97843/g.276791  ORF Transcript_97843/g.276791 Transcript_97843/m.276791 type:complete len:240 (-) Transcript_97843:318-1037(-)